MEEYVEILFRYLYEDREEPITESLWAVKTGETYELRNIPFYVRAVAWGDVFAAEEVNGILRAGLCLKSSGNSTIRILLSDREQLDELVDTLERRYGCDWESSDLGDRMLLAVNIHRDLSYLPIKLFLEDGFEQGRWDYEEGCLSEQHQLVEGGEDGMGEE